MDRESPVSRIKTKDNSIGVCKPGGGVGKGGLSKAGDDCPCTCHTYVQQAILMSLKSLCDCFPFAITKAEAYVMHQGHSASDEWIFDLGWWLGTES